MKIVTIVGARPQFIKAGAVSRAIREFNKRSQARLNEKRRMREIWVHTGQHYDYLMDKVFFEELRLPKPDYHLGVGSGSHAKQTGWMLERIERVLEKEKPAMVVVYGDTNSTLAGALAAAKLKIPVGHVEAGLRSYVRSMPEEINRVVTDHLSTFLFCPTSQAVKNLRKEGIQPGRGRVVKKVGDVMYDSILYYSKLAGKKSSIIKDLGLGLSAPSSRTERSQTVPCRAQDYYLATLHRAESTDDPKRLKSVLEALNEIGERIPMVLPLHPRTKKMIGAYGFSPGLKNVQCIEPVSYFDMLELERNAKAVLTDSGGIQKEAYWFRVPCLTLREETEWVETVWSGWNELVGTEPKRIVRAVNSLRKRKFSKKDADSFGDGRASRRIVDLLAKSFKWP